MGINSIADLASFFNYRGAALRESDYSTMVSLEHDLRSPIPHLYDEMEIISWPDEEYEEGHNPYAKSHPRPWRLYLLRYPWKRQLRPGDFAFITKKGHVTGLSLSEPNLLEIPPPVFQFEHLTRLLLAGNKFTNVPGEIGKLKKLQILAFGEDIDSLPESLGRLKHLSFLELTDSRIRELPKTLLNNPSLRRIVIDTRFPTEDPTLIALKRKGVVIEVVFGESYEPTRDEIVKWILDFMSNHPQCRWRDFNDALMPRGYLFARDIIQELVDEGKIQFNGES